MILFYKNRKISVFDVILYLKFEEKLFTFVLLMIVGGICGYLLRKRAFPDVMTVITWLVYALLLLLGIEVGANEVLVSSLHSIGVTGAIIAVVSTIGSCLCAMLLWHWAGKDMKRGTKVSGSTIAKSESPLKGSIVIVGFFAVGIILGFFRIIPDTYVRDISYGVLCVMLFCVGFGLGCKPAMLKRFRSLSPRLMLLPVVTIIGTLIACLLLSFFMNYSIPSVLAVGSGFGYYSLSSILISQSLGAELGTIALLCNIVRELMVLLGAPLLAKMFGPLAPISAGGATTMDSTLPVIMRTLGEDFVLLSMFHGFLVDFSVPFLVTFFCSL